MVSGTGKKKYRFIPGQDLTKAEIPKNIFSYIPASPGGLGDGGDKVIQI
jgi:hypothetical protein